MLPRDYPDTPKPTHGIRLTGAGTEGQRQFQQSPFRSVFFLVPGSTVQTHTPLPSLSNFSQTNQLAALVHPSSFATAVPPCVPSTIIPSTDTRSQQFRPYTRVESATILMPGTRPATPAHRISDPLDLAQSGSSSSLASSQASLQQLSRSTESLSPQRLAPLATIPLITTIPSVLGRSEKKATDFQEPPIAEISSIETVQIPASRPTLQRSRTQRAIFSTGAIDNPCQSASDQQRPAFPLQPIINNKLLRPPRTLEPMEARAIIPPIDLPPQMSATEIQSSIRTRHT